MLGYTMWILVLIFAIVVFLFLREVFCWYLKINQRIFLLEDIKTTLIKIEKTNSEILTNHLNNNSKQIHVKKNSKQIHDKNNTELHTKKYNQQVQTADEKFYLNVEAILKSVNTKIDTNDERELLNRYIKLDYYELIDIGKNLQDLTETGKKVYNLLINEIENIDNKY